MSTVIASNLELQAEDYDSSRAVSTASLHNLAKVVQWVKQNSSDIIGTVESVALTEAQFAALKGYDLLDGQGSPIDEASKKWVLIQGQSILGSDYSTLTGLETLPSMTGGESLVQSSGSLSIGSYTAGENKSHVHQQSVLLESGETDSITGATIHVSDTASGATTAKNIAASEQTTTALVGPQNTLAQGDSINKASGMAINFFIKINN